jgi:hypothetical protein
VRPRNESDRPYRRKSTMSVLAKAASAILRTPRTVPTFTPSAVSKTTVDERGDHQKLRPVLQGYGRCFKGMASEAPKDCALSCGSDIRT